MKHPRDMSKNNPISVRSASHASDGYTEEGATVQTNDSSSGTPAEQLSRLVYELLDAHADTICMGDELSGDLEWEAHLEYLRGLQRVSREMLANLDAVPIS
jgi:hypothetical protein